MERNASHARIRASHTGRQSAATGWLSYLVDQCCPRVKLDRSTLGRTLEDDIGLTGAEVLVNSTLPWD
jgi:hypothetical protein